MNYESNISNINFELGYFNNIKLSLPLQDIYLENTSKLYKVNGLDMQNINIENNKINFSFDLIGKNISLGKKTIQAFISDNNANYIFIGTNIINVIKSNNLSLIPIIPIMSNISNKQNDIISFKKHIIKKKCLNNLKITSPSLVKYNREYIINSINISKNENLYNSEKKNLSNE